MMKRRVFIRKAAMGACSLQIPFVLNSCTVASKKTDMLNSSEPLKISLAQWSLHRSIESGLVRAEDFAAIAIQDYGLDAVEYVNGFYREKASDEKFWHQMRSSSDQYGVTNLLIMVDEEGDLGSQGLDRKKTVENHYKWINAAKILGCHSVRVNAFGDGDKATVKAAVIDSMRELCAYAAKENINVLIENHGLYSADAGWVGEIMKAVDLPNCGTLPDFGNWCINAKWGSTQDDQCTESYDRYQGVMEMLPFAKGVSAKSYHFGPEGNETKIDFGRMIQLVKKSGFRGHIGIEYEGTAHSEQEGIMATKSLLERLW